MTTPKTAETALVERHNPIHDLMFVRGIISSSTWADADKQKVRDALDRAEQALIAALSQPQPLPREGTVGAGIKISWENLIERSLRSHQHDRETVVPAEYARRVARTLLTLQAADAAPPPHDGQGEVEALRAEVGRLKDENRRLKQSDHKTPSERLRDADNWEDLPW